MSWLKAAHIATLTVWCACLFYLPSLLAECREAGTRARAKRAHIKTRATFVLIASPAAVLSIITGTVLAYAVGAGGGWLVAKLTVVTLMVLFHLQCGRLVTALDDLHRLRSVRRLLAMVLAPAVLIPTTLWLVLGKPF